MSIGLSPEQQAAINEASAAMRESAHFVDAFRKLLQDYLNAQMKGAESPVKHDQLDCLAIGLDRHVELLTANAERTDRLLVRY